MLSYILNRPAVRNRGSAKTIELCLSLLFIPAFLHAAALTKLYSTGFDKSEGYDPKFELIGQKGWVTDSSSFGGNGLLTNYFNSQAAYIGLFSLDPLDDSLSLWQPINFDPTTNAKPIVKFTARMAVIDSTTTNRDDFYWSVYNSNADRLFTLDFDNDDLGIYYVLDDTNGFWYTGVNFTNDKPYNLSITMDFTRNSWSAALDDTSLVTNQPITTVRSRLDLGDVDAVWAVFNRNLPGDNFMIFDDYQITAQSLPQATLTPLGYSNNGQFALRLNGDSGNRFAIETTTNWVQWAPLKTNLVTDGSFDFVDTISPPGAQRFYRGRLVP